MLAAALHLRGQEISLRDIAALVHDAGRVQPAWPPCLFG
jgi:hypothetical protein